MGVPTITFGFHLIFTFITAHKKYLHPERNLQIKMLNWHKIPEKKTCPEQISEWVTLEHGRNSPVLLVKMAWSEFLSCFTFTLPNNRQELTHFRIASISSGDANMISSASRVSRKSCNSSFSTSLSRN